ncbi:MAG TPA: thiamine diphosphokinase [Candidatus Deferrimicrobiaceae bacterium]|nr:thiamine diphosphokinase [Candidatus Deferrimicrobiaceae bacterium]
MAAADAGRAIVLANGEAPSPAVLDAAWPGWADGVEIVIAADGGARHAPTFGLRIDLWVGDADSYPEAEVRALEAAGVAVRRLAQDKNETDTEIAIVESVAAGATDITILGALGGIRVDHALANVALLAHPALAGRTARLLGEGGVRLTLVTAPGPGGEPVERELAGRTGDLVSLLPLFGRVEGVRSDGLRYPLRDEPLEIGPARGVSNVRVEPTARVRVRVGRLLVVETPANLRP